MINKFILTVILAVGVILASPAPAQAISVVVHIPEKYNEVHAGERIYFQVEVKYPENPTRIDLRLNYAVEKQGEVLAESQALKAVETQASFMDFLVLPDSSETGKHDIKIAVRDYGDLSEEVGSSFHVVGEKADRSTLYFAISMGSVVFLGILVGIDILRRRS